MRCDCCDLPVESCGKAAEARLRAEAARDRDRLLRAGWAPAVYPGRCAVCQQGFPTGMLIRQAKPKDGRYHWTAECCAEEEV